MRPLQAHEVINEVLSGSMDLEDHVLQILERVKEKEDTIRAFIALAPESSIRARVREVREWLREGRRPRLAGLVVAVKDNISTSFLPTTAGSRILEGYVPPFDATVVRRLMEEGAIVIGKTNMDEFAMGSTTELSAYWPTRNPWDLERVPGGSSGGSAAALAYGGADLALGSDTGGSIRLPAAYTATVGLKPTYGLVSRYGLIPYANSLEQIGPMARSVRDLALLLDVISGHDPRDATTLRVPPTSTFIAKPADPRSLRVCAPPELLEASEPPVKAAITKLLGRLESEGAAVIYDRHLTTIDDALAVYYTIALAEAASNLARYDGKLYPFVRIAPTYTGTATETRSRGFGPEVKRRIIMGVTSLSEGYRDELYMAAAKGRRVIRDEVLAMSRNCLIAGSVSPVLPPRLGERITDPLKLYALDIYTVIANLSGVPSLTLPVDFYSDLPIGMQLMGPPLSEAQLISAGLLVESLTGLAGVAAP